MKFFDDAELVVWCCSGKDDLVVLAEFVPLAFVQNFEGVCIARANKGVGSNFTVRKISFGESVERVFPLYSPIIESIEVVRRGAVRRAKLYYLRVRTGKSARIAERRDVRRDVTGGKGAETEATRADNAPEA